MKCGTVKRLLRRTYCADTVDMGLFFSAKKPRCIGILCSLLLVYALCAQDADILNDSVSSTDGSREKSEFAGIWENSERFVYFDGFDSAQTKIVLKPFYRYYYDGPYPPGKEAASMPLALVNGGIYAEFWTSHRVPGGTFWRPENNRNDFTTENVPAAREIAGFYTSDDFKTVYKIRYWITKADFTEERAELRIGAAAVSDEPVLIDKYIKIGDSVYTCATGRRTYVRNPEKLVSLPEGARAADILVFGEPLLKPSAVADLEAEIRAHNSIVYPPRNGRARFREPSIYKKLETMDIDDFDNIGTRVK
ncbi:hypothetical protein V1L52_06920 [Treponema sp. HNW]|uniref:hypothetical protein n=1 Tax=Treponema sp. HNW TaxID=3116654 RepID=UPI003D112697